MFTKTEIEKYFIAEKQESLLFLIIGITAIILAVIFFFVLKTSFYKGAAVPLIVIGLVQAVVGYTVYVRSDAQRIDTVYAYDMDPSRLKNKELPRMKTVNQRFVIYRYVEIALAITGLVCIILYNANNGKSFWFGLGITLCIQSLLMLGADYFAEKRANEYTNGIGLFTKQ